MTPRIHWLDQPRIVGRLKRGAIAVLALTVLVEPLVHMHPQFQADSWFGFSAAYGFLACLLMIALAKALGWLLKRPDTFYAKDDADE